MVSSGCTSKGEPRDFVDRLLWEWAGERRKVEEEVAGEESQRSRLDTGRWENPPPTHTHALSMSQSPECIISYGKRDVANVIMLRILRWEGYPDCPTWAHYHHVGLYQEAGGSESEKEAERGGVGEAAIHWL